jgi:glycerol-3-phosphate dehydrogenase
MGSGMHLTPVGTLNIGGAVLEGLQVVEKVLQLQDRGMMIMPVVQVVTLVTPAALVVNQVAFMLIQQK